MKLKKNDIILIAVIAILAIGFGAYYYFGRTEDSNARVIITVNGQVYQDVSLYEDQTIEIVYGDYTNTLVIEDGYAKMKDANCSDQICVYQKEIHYNGESIVCLPHLVLVTIEGGEEYSLDSVAN